MKAPNGYRGGDGCPSADDLLAFAVGRLPADARETIASHIESCAACLTRLNQLDDQNDPLVAELRGPIPTDLFSHDACTPVEAKGGRGDGMLRAAKPSPGAVGRLAVPGYDILQELGRGGMGVVYQARQVRLNRLVALKMILAGLHAGTEQQARFRIEAEAVARLQHPNIVQIYEVGDQDNQSYLALEFVDGGSLAQQRAGTPLPPAPAARLVETLARAVQHAHQRNIVHRDLKPANVLLTADGVPKITDFGLAKRLEEEGVTGSSGAIMGTPSYMAPEQARGNTRQVGPAVDLYALGAILYELLTGRPPFKAATALETLQQVVHEEPVPPRQLQPKLPHDLETICLKCLRKEPSQRYAGAGELAEDLQRYLRGEPIRARPVGRFERLWRWCRRNPAGAAVVGLLVSAVVGLSAGLLVLDQANRRTEQQRHQTEQQRDQAQKRLGQVEKATELLGSVFRDLDPNVEEKEGKSLRVLLGERLDQAAEQLDAEAVGDPLTVARIQSILGRSLWGLGHLDKAAAVVEKARRTQDALLGPDHLDTLISKHNLAQLYGAQGKYAQAEPLFQEVLQAFTAKLGADHPDTLTNKSTLAGLYLAQGKYAQAELLLKEALQGRTVQLGADHPDTLLSKHNLALLDKQQGKYAQAEPLFQEALQGRTVQFGTDHPDTLLSKHSLAQLYQDQGKYAQAEPLFQEVLQTQTVKLGADHPHTLTSKHNLAALYKVQAKYAQAEPLYQEVLQARTVKLGADHPDTLTSKSNLALLYEVQGKYAQAEPLCQEVLQTRLVKLGADHPDTLTSKNNLALLYKQQGKYAQAEPLYQEVLQTLTAKLGADHPLALFSKDNLAQLYRAQRKYAEAEPLFQEVLQGLTAKFGADHPDTLFSKNNLGTLYRDQGKDGQAEPLFKEAAEGARGKLGLAHPRTQLYLDNLTDCYTRLKQPEKGEPLLRELATAIKAKAGAESPAYAARLAALGENLLRQSRFGDAETVLRQGLAIRDQKLPNDWPAFHTKSLLGASLLGQKNYAAAEPLLVQGYEGLKQRQDQIPPRSKARLTEALERLVQLYDGWGKNDQADEWRKRRATETAPAPLPK
jgi:tetratricopeptide (TPR) repeat protein